jgi:hypothetical protein
MEGAAMMQATIPLQQEKKLAPGWTTASSLTDEVQQWCLLLALPLVGMLLLLACMQLPSVFSTLGAFMIYVGAKVIAKRMEATWEGDAGRPPTFPARL